MIRVILFALIMILPAILVRAEDLPQQEKAPSSAEPAPPAAKFFPINPATMMRPPIRNAYIATANPKPPVMENRKFTNGTTSISEEQAKKLLEIYAN